VVASLTVTFEESAGRVRLDIAGLSGAEQALTVTRQSVRPHRSGTAAVPYDTSVVRGYNATSVLGTTYQAFDYEYDPSDGSTYWSTAYRVTTDAGVDVSATIRPVQSATWIKSVQHPRNNLALEVDTDLHLIDVSDLERGDRTGVFQIVGSHLPVVVTDVHTSREFTISVYTATLVAALDLEALLYGGDILFLQGPAGLEVPGPLYFAPGKLSVARLASTDPARVTTIPVLEVATPSLDVVGVAWNYQTVKEAYASYAALKAAWGSYAELMAGPAPGDVTV
jgi:hypothetical protein